MIKEINHTAEIENRLFLEGKTTERNPLEELNGIIRMNKTMEEVQRDFKVKNKNSELSASKTILTA